jgi:WD40 repeat protein
LIALTSGNFASSSNDSSIKIWSPTTESLLKTLTGHTGGVNGLAALSSDRLASVGADGTLKIWSASRENSTSTIKVSIWGPLTAIATLTNGNVAVALSSGNSIKVYNPNDGAAVSLSSTPTHTSRINFLLTLSNGNLASASNDKVKIWNSGSGSLLKTLSSPKDDVLYLKEIGSDLACATKGSKIKLWDLTTESIKTTIVYFSVPYSIEYLLNKYMTIGTTLGYLDFYSTNGKLQKTYESSMSTIHAQLKLANGNLVIGDFIGVLKILKF